MRVCPCGRVFDEELDYRKHMNSEHEALASAVLSPKSISITRVADRTIAEFDGERFDPMKTSVEELYESW